MSNGGFADGTRDGEMVRLGDENAKQVARAALVTGGAQRIGGAIVRALADAGYAVAIHANRSTTAAQELCRDDYRRWRARGRGDR